MGLVAASQSSNGRQQVDLVHGLTHRHDAIMNWCLANPHRPLKECAVELGYSRNYVYMITNSDMWQAKYQKICVEQGVEARHAGASVKEKLQSLAHLSLEELHNRLQAGVLDNKSLISSSRLALASLGYGQPTRQPEANVTQVFVGSDVIAAARERVLRTSQPTPTVIEVDPEGGVVPQLEASE